MTFWLCIGLLMQVVNKAAEFEQRALEAHASYAITLAILCFAGRGQMANSGGGEVRAGRGAVRGTVAMGGPSFRAEP